MLYDQAQLAIVYTEAYQITHDRFYADTTRNILDFALREMQQPRRGFASARDADSRIAARKSETSEGVFYVWTAKEIESVLSKQDAAGFENAYGGEAGGNVAAQPGVRGGVSRKNGLFGADRTGDSGKECNLP